MKRLLVCAFAGIAMLAIPAGGFDHAAMAKSKAQIEREKACAWCWDWCKKNPGQICHCGTRSGCPKPTSGATIRQ